MKMRLFWWKWGFPGVIVVVVCHKSAVYSKIQILKSATHAKFGQAPILDSATPRYECQHRSVITSPLTTSAKNKSELTNICILLCQITLVGFLLMRVGLQWPQVTDAAGGELEMWHVPLGLLASEKTNRSLSQLPVTTIHTIYHVLRAL